MRRRTFLAGTATVAVSTAVSSPVAWAAGGSGGGVHERVVRDARMEWRRLPDGWQSAPFLGNGRLAAHVYGGANGNELTFMLNHSVVQDQREYWEAAIGLSRLPIGYLTLAFAGTITGVDWTLDPWDAELSGTVTTTLGSAEFSAVVLNDRDVLLVSLTGTDSPEWTFNPLRSATTRTIRVPPDYVANPDPTLGTAEEVRYAEQPLLAGGGYTTAWGEKRVGTRRLLATHIAYRFPGAAPTAEAIAAVGDALSANPDRLVSRHRSWWHRFYPRSFVSIPDKYVQRFYWLQLYKLASATRADAPVVTVWGPWFPEKGNNWTAVWWNTNVQTSYLLANGSNHAELDAVTTTFRRYEHNLPLSVPEAYRDGETYALGHPSDGTLRPGGTRTVGVPGSDHITDQNGNLIWGLHNAWLSYRHSMDKRALRHVIYPILGKALNFYSHFLTEGADGHLHLPTTRSPEYANASDATYDLSLIRWACRTLVDTVGQLHISDPRLPRWQEILTRLTPYHEDRTAGVMIGDGVPLAESHRHYSHLLWLYPLREKVWDNPGDRDIMRRTFDHWTSRQDRWHGYSYAAASSMCSVMSDPEPALDFLRFFLDRNIVDGTQLTPNTMYREGSNFAVESPLAAAQSVLDMLVQSHGGVVKVFPSVSERWPDASFAGLRTEGAFLVDASRNAGRTEWVRVRSEAGERLTLRHGINGAIDVRDDRGRAVPWRPVGTGTIALRLRKGASAVIRPRGSRPNLTPRDVAPTGSAPVWGLPDPLG
ncbi:MAG TPA: hypothetical protein VF106_44990 [Actinophytocola sp.]